MLLRLGLGLTLLIFAAALLLLFAGSDVAPGASNGSLAGDAPGAVAPDLPDVSSQEVGSSRGGERSLISAGAPQSRVLRTFLHGEPVETVMLTTDGVSRPRLKATSHVISDEAATKSDGEIALYCDGACVRLVPLRDVPHGDTRIDMVPARRLHVQLVNVPPGLHDIVALEALITFESDQSALERSAHIALTRPVIFAGDRCEVPLAVDRGGELTVCARPRHGGPGYTVKRAFTAHDVALVIDVSSLSVCLQLGDLDVTLAFRHLYPRGELRLALFDAGGSCLLHANAFRSDEATLAVPLRGIAAGRYRLELQLESHLAIRLDEVDVRPGAQQVRCDVAAESSVDVLVACGSADALRAARIVVVDGSGNPLADPGRSGEREDLFHVRSLPAGTYFVQVRCEDHSMASAVATVHLGEADVQQTSLVLERAGKVRVVRSDEVAYVDFVNAAGITSRFFLPRAITTVWCALGPHTAIAGGAELPVDVRAGAVTELTLP